MKKMHAQSLADLVRMILSLEPGGDKPLAGD